LKKNYDGKARQRPERRAKNAGVPERSKGQDLSGLAKAGESICQSLKRLTENNCWKKQDLSYPVA